MALNVNEIAEQLETRFAGRFTQCRVAFDEVTLEVPAEQSFEVLKALRDDESLAFDQLIDVCGVDYSTFGQSEWETQQVSSSGFARGREDITDAASEKFEKRFAAVYHLMSVQKNHRLRVKVFCEDSDFPMVDSVVSIWSVADWFEREAFDMFGILFNGHPDLRRLLTDYGFVGHPFRKDFPLIGHVEMRYDETKKRVVYEPVSIEPRVLVPKVIRHDSRYDEVPASSNTSDAE